jgi:hypothetical protein
MKKKFEKLMTVYAINDCLSVTKLAQKLVPVDPLTPPHTIDYEQIFDDDDDDEILWNETEQLVYLCPLKNDNDKKRVHVHDEPLNELNELDKVHVQNELEMISDDDEILLNDNEQSIYLHPFNDDNRIQGVHVRDEFSEFNVLNNFDESNDLNKLNEINPFNIRNELHEIASNKTTPVHTRNEFLDGLETISEDDQPEQKEKTKPTLTRNQRKNRKKRINRYRFSVIRNIYHKFNIDKIKTILINLNIHYVNINIVGQTLFIGLKNKTIQERVNQLLGDDMLNKEHYNRIEKRRNHRREEKNILTCA